MKNISRLRTYLWVSSLFILTGLVIILLGDKTGIHLAINRHHTGFLDILFRWITWLGDGLVTTIGAIVVVILAQRHVRVYLFVLGGCCLFFSGLIVQILKQVIYPDAERPLKFIGRELLHLVQGVDMHEMNSFPSGHTATAFAFFAFVAFVYSRSKLLQCFFVLLAVLVGYSRMYLSQHFLEDVVMGGIIGILSFLLAFVLSSLLPFRNRI